MIRPPTSVCSARASRAPHTKTPRRSRNGLAMKITDSMHDGAIRHVATRKPGRRYTGLLSTGTCTALNAPPNLASDSRRGGARLGAITVRAGPGCAEDARSAHGDVRGRHPLRRRHRLPDQAARLPRTGQTRRTGGACGAGERRAGETNPEATGPRLLPAVPLTATLVTGSGPHSPAAP